MDADTCVYLLSLVAIQFSFGVDGEAGLGECGREVGRRVVEGGAIVVDGDADELDAAPSSSEGT